MQAFLAAKEYIKEHPELVEEYSKQFEKRESRISNRGGDRRSKEIGSPLIAWFLSKDGKTVAHDEVATLLRIGENLYIGVFS